MRAAIICLFMFLWAEPALAFPEMIKHGYTNCMACHVSPTGGGVLTEYGRALSKELLSTWGVDGEENFLYAIPTTQNVALGGDIRWLQIYDDIPGGFRERYIVMQRDFEAALTLDKFTVAGTAGVWDPKLDGNEKFISRRHYLLYQATQELSLRAGRFYPAFGLYLPDHFTNIRAGLGWDQAMESYNVEAAYQTERWNMFGTVVLGRPDDPSLKREKGSSISIAYNPSDKSKIGLSHYYGETDEVTHHYFGPHMVWGLGEKYFVLAQLNTTRTFLYTQDKANMGLLNYLRLDAEWVKGFHVYIAQEFSQLNLDNGATRRDIFSLGTQFFPRPHFEFQVVGQKRYTRGLSTTPDERIYILAHFYL